MDALFTNLSVGFAHVFNLYNLSMLTIGLLGELMERKNTSGPAEDAYSVKRVLGD